MDTRPITLITPSDVIEYLFCPRFIYFMYAAGIPQFEEERYKVQRGREVHEIKQIRNINYLWKKIGCVKREMSIYLSSREHHLRGVVDEVLTLEDGTLAPLDYKFAKYQEKIFRTHRFQIICYSILIRENYQKSVNRGFVLYTRSNTFKEIPFRREDEDELSLIINDILKVIDKGYFPAGSKFKCRCLDCTYRNICCH